MFLAAAVPTSSSPAVSAAAFMAGASANAALGRMPVREVPAVLSEGQVLFRLQGNVPARVTADTAKPVPAATDAPIRPLLAAPSGSDGFSSAFMAQMLSLSDSEARSYLRAYEKLLTLAKVRYKPSDAALPEPESALPASDFFRLLEAEALQPAANQNEDLAALQPANEDAPLNDIPFPELMALQPAAPLPAPVIEAYSALPQRSTPPQDYRPVELSA